MSCIVAQTSFPLIRGLRAHYELFVPTAELQSLQDYVDAEEEGACSIWTRTTKPMRMPRRHLEAAKAKATEAKDAVKSARAAVLEALKTVSDPPAVVRLPRHNLTQRNLYRFQGLPHTLQA